MRSSRRSLILVVVCWLGVAASVLCAESPFVNDFEAVEWEDEWSSITYFGIVSDDSDRVTLFWHARIPHPVYSQIRQVYYRRFDSFGEPLSGNVLITDSTCQSNYSAIYPGSNYSGKWALACALHWTEADCWPYCHEETRAWASDEEGNQTDTGFAVGSEVDEPLGNHRGAADVDSSGNIVVAWMNIDSWNIWAQEFDPEGNPLTDTIRVTDGSYPGDFTLLQPMQARVAVTPGGEFVVTFDAICDECEPGDRSHEIFARAYYGDGSPKTDLVCTSCWEGSPSIYVNGATDANLAIEDNGDFAVAWVEVGTYGYCQMRTMMRRFDADCTPKSDPVVVDSGMCYNNLACWVASDSVGNLVVTWQDDRTSFNGYGNLMAQRYDTAGNAVGEKLQINDGYNDVAPIFTPVTLNNNGLVGFFWIGSSPSGTSCGMAQFMDLEDVGVYVSCDANNDRLVNITDAVFLINYIFSGGVPPAHECLGNANGDDLVNITDAVALIGYIFNGGEIVENCPM